MDAIPQTWNGKPLICHWEYKNSVGETIGITARYQKGTGKKEVVPFFKRNGKGFSVGGPLRPKPLYGLDNLAINANEKSVFIVEGEPKASALQSLGFIGISSIGGADAAAGSDWSPLSGRVCVYLLPDNNSPGKRYIDNIATILRALDIPPEIIVVQLPGLPDGGDIVDWIQQRLPDWDRFSPVHQSERDRLRSELLWTITEYSRPCSNAEHKAVPVPLEKNPHDNLPPFPLGTLPKVLRQAANEIARFNKVPQESPATISLSMTAMALGKNAQVIERPGLDHYPSLFFALVADSGDRKSQPYKQLQKPIVEFSIGQTPN